MADATPPRERNEGGGGALAVLYHRISPVVLLLSHNHLSGPFIPQSDILMPLPFQCSDLPTFSIPLSSLTRIPYLSLFT